MLNGEASSLEQEELTHHLQQDELLQQQYDLLARIWKERHDDIKDEDNINARATVSRIISRAASETEGAEVTARRKRRGRRKRIYITVAAFALIITSIAGLFWKNHTASSVITKQPEQETFITPKGSRSNIILADGTTVWLNAGSKLSYENDFNGATREVRLEGEAFFDVVKQPRRPFIVHTSGIDIRVLGTTFNVKSYPEDKNVETTLYKGSVEVIRHEDLADTVIQLIPNRKLTLPKKAANEPVKLSAEKMPFTKKIPESFVITPIDSTKKESERIETAWVYSRLEIKDENMEEVAMKMERWYNVSIVLADDKVRSIKGVVATFTTETIDQALAALKEGFPINYKINKNEILVGSSE